MDAELFWQEAKSEERDSGFTKVVVLCDGVYWTVRTVYADWDLEAIVIEIEDD